MSSVAATPWRPPIHRPPFLPLHHHWRSVRAAASPLPPPAAVAAERAASTAAATPFPIRSAAASPPVIGTVPSP
eukprot:scaffold127442_cov21-Tisochrysis_lutea.AAC.2